MQDEKILLGIQNREEDVMAKVIDRYSRLLWPIAAAVLEHVGDSRDVEECVADAFIYLWANPQKFDPRRGSLKTLLCIVTRSRAIDRYRELSRRQTIPLEEVVLGSGLGVQEDYLRRENSRELTAAVNALEEPAREILIRRYYYGQKPRQIALALDMTVKQVDNSLYRSKHKLREMLSAG